MSTVEESNINGINGAEIEEKWSHTAAGVMGNMLEWYDFALFGFFSDIIADVFFPPSKDKDGENDNLIKTFVIFGGAFLMRPIGGLMIGYMGDKHGRKVALTRSMLLMAIPTTLMGCLPTYATAGVIAPVLLTLCRLLQGISVGGQLPASLVYTAEKRDKSQWGYYGSLPMTAANVGTLLGNLCAASLREILTEEQLRAWGWRLPFFSGILIAFAALYLRASGADVHTNEGVYDSSESEHANPIKFAFRKGNRLAILEAALTPMLWASGFYVSFVWMAVFMDELLEPPIPGAFWINTCSMLFGMTFLLPLAGHLSDVYGRVFLMTISGVLLSALGPFMVIIISKGNPFFAFMSQLALGIMLSFFGGPLCAWLIENFSAEVRLTSVSIGYDLAHAVVGGFSPALATALFGIGPYAPGLIYFVFGVISLMGIYITYFCGGDQREEVEGDVELKNEGETLENGKPPMDPVENSELPDIS